MVGEGEIPVLLGITHSWGRRNSCKGLRMVREGEIPVRDCTWLGKGSYCFKWLCSHKHTTDVTLSHLLSMSHVVLRFQRVS